MCCLYGIGRYMVILVIKRSLLPIGDKVLKVGDTVKTKAVNNETFIGKIIGLDRYGFATVTFSGISESRIQLIHLTKENN